MTKEATEVFKSLEPLFKKAKKERLYFYCSFTGQWFSPEQLKRKQVSGNYIWGPPNWQLRKPSERTKELKQVILTAKKRLIEWQITVLEDKEGS